MAGGVGEGELPNCALCALPPSSEPEAAAGEAPARADQPEPEPAEGSSIAAAGRGGESLGAQKTETESLGAPSEAGGPAWSRGSVGIQRPACDLRDGVVGTTARLESIWVQERGAQLPSLLWGVSLV